ncbi:hypothetical protein JCM17380_23810 [Desulfosporosinus burensis]
MRMLRRLAEVDKREDLSRMRLGELTPELGVDDIYLADANGVYVLATEPEIEGTCVYDIDADYRRISKGEIEFLATPIIKRLGDDKLFKFMTARRMDGKRSDGYFLFGRKNFIVGWRSHSERLRILNHFDNHAYRNDN